MHHLAEHRADSGHLGHQPLDGIVFGSSVGRQQLAGFLGQIQQDRAGFEAGIRLAARPIRIDDDGDFGVRIQRQKFGVELLAGKHIDRRDGKLQAEFFQRDVDFDDVGAAHAIQGNHMRSILYANGFSAFRIRRRVPRSGTWSKYRRSAIPPESRDESSSERFGRATWERQYPPPAPQRGPCLS